MKKSLIIVSLFMTSILGFANVKPLNIDVTEGAKLPNFELRDFHGKYTKSKNCLEMEKLHFLFLLLNGVLIVNVNYLLCKNFMKKIKII